MKMARGGGSLLSELGVVAVKQHFLHVFDSSWTPL